MTFHLDTPTLLFGLVIFCSRVADVSIGTLRTISIVNGRSLVAFFLGMVEISLWLAVVSTVILEIGQRPILGVFYVLGFATGNAVGIAIERRIAFGHAVMRVFTAGRGREMAQAVRNMGHGVTTFAGEGVAGPVTELLIVSRRRDQKKILSTIRTIEPKAFYVTEQVGAVSKLYRPLAPQPTGWRSVLKKK
ncbi:MAG: DUF2179 domain-containing protein [Desulfovibrionaceae bacterium]|jgi:uncharacterized protein YebE (UPF0316 family)